MKNRLILLLATTYFLVFPQTVPTYIPTNGLLAWWPYNGNANDESGYSNNGVVYGAGLTTDRFNAYNSAYSFNGLNNYISIPDNLNFRPASFTISSWIYFNTFMGTQMILSKNCGSNTYESIGIYSGASNLNSVIGTISSYGQFLISPNNLQTGKWYNYIDQFNDQTNIHKIFINGVMTFSTVENTSIGYDSKAWTIGMEYENNSPSYYFNGKIDDIAIWNRFLNDNEIMQVYQSANTTNLNEHGAIEIVEIFPNPCNNQFTLNVDSECSNCQYLISDLTGREVATGKLIGTTAAIDIAYLEHGIYLLKVKTKKEKIIKIIKN